MRLSIIVADFFGGLFLEWWKRNHNVHQMVTNAPDHDPDIEHMPLMAVVCLSSFRCAYLSQPHIRGQSK